ncbi:uncharacterized protein FOMMEDRAFT_159526 [Fomitiporia mediterranea MF3/22]|uniref:uncharacterized protein n=1 Tax=Fomitiporia mediterranea (strain MF3/22) TaxID=694068 RepID=UPI00044089B3|nr:uncharacterized protein FOMMEDRAFT_159526 [Fomitiporia mediterranea MF3/22]EJC99949.1 hypothetical protein FOMMEDRAFT_159526 [Fomitiporia mediterranea MF3/22]
MSSLDVLIVHQNSELEERLRSITSSYFSGTLELSELFDAAYDLSGKYSSQNDFLALSTGHIGMEDVWCIDQRGVLTIVLTKETYEQLGLVGEKVRLSGSGKAEVHAVYVDLHERTSSQFTRAKEAIRLWDERRRVQGIGPWRVCVQALPSNLETELKPETVQPSVTTTSDILVPVLDHEDGCTFGGVTNTSTGGEESKADAEEDRQERMNELFEWVGMACIGSDRLKANDRVNPFVAVYEPPTPKATVGDVTHFRWRGLLGPSTIRSVLETTTDFVKRDDASTSFVAITANTFSNAPLSYISLKAFEEGAKNEARLGRSSRTVRCWSLIVKPSGQENGVVDWVLASC